MIEVQGAKVFVHREGSGRPLLMLHGNPDSHRVWLPLIERLRDRHDCIAPDLPGFGASAIPLRNDVTLAGFVRWIDDLLAALAIKGPIDLIVHDIGGFYGLAWASRNRQRLHRLVISNTLLHADYRWHFWARVWRSRFGELAMRAFDWPLFGKAALGLTMRQGGPGLTRQQIADTHAHFHPAARAQVLRIYREADPAKFAAWTQALLAVIAACPTRVIWGLLDPFIPLSFARSFGQADVQLIVEAGHWVPLEAVDRVAGLVEEHLSAP